MLDSAERSPIVEVVRALLIEPLSGAANAPYRSTIELAVSYLEGGNCRKAKRAFTSAVKMDSEMAQAWLGLAICEAHVGESGSMDVDVDGVRKLLRRYEIKRGGDHDKLAQAMIWTTVLFHGLDLVGEYLKDVGQNSSGAAQADIERDIATTVAAFSLSAAKRTRAAPGAIAGYAISALAVNRSARLRDGANRLRALAHADIGECLFLLHVLADVVQRLSGVADDDTTEAAASSWCALFRRTLALSVSEGFNWRTVDSTTSYCLINRIRSVEARRRFNAYLTSSEWLSFRRTLGIVAYPVAAFVVGFLLFEFSPEASGGWVYALTAPIGIWIVALHIRHWRLKSNVSNLLGKLSPSDIILRLLRELPASDQDVKGNAASNPQSRAVAPCTCPECGALAPRSNLRCIYCAATFPWAYCRDPSSYSFSGWIDGTDLSADTSAEAVLNAISEMIGQECDLGLKRLSREDGSCTVLNIDCGESSEITLELEYWGVDDLPVERYRLHTSRASAKKVVQNFFECRDGLDGELRWIRDW